MDCIRKILETSKENKFISSESQVKRTAVTETDQLAVSKGKRSKNVGQCLILFQQTSTASMKKLKVLPVLNWPSLSPAVLTCKVISQYFAWDLQSSSDILYNVKRWQKEETWI